LIVEILAGYSRFLQENLLKYDIFVTQAKKNMTLYISIINKVPLVLFWENKQRTYVTTLKLNMLRETISSDKNQVFF
jgi:hypothetical protein